MRVPAPSGSSLLRELGLEWVNGLVVKLAGLMAIVGSSRLGHPW